MTKLNEKNLPESCWNKAKDEEMLFILLGRDKAAPSTIRAWVKERILSGKNEPDDLQIEEALRCAKLMEERE